MLSCHSNEEKEGIQMDNKYVGDAACMSCHSQIYDSWQTSDHAMAMAKATATTILGAFDSTRVHLDGVDYFFHHSDSSWYVDLEEIDSTKHQYKIANTFGRRPLQQYLVDFPRGRKQVLRASWDVKNAQWFHQYEGDTIAVNDWLHWTRGAQSWNTMCAECHTTDLRKNYLSEADSFHTTYSSINVSCESCHGPGKKHIKLAKQGDISYPATEPRLASQKNQLSVCAACHSRRIRLTNRINPNVSFENQFILQTLNNQFYFRDGQIKAEDYVYGSFLQSKMYANGVKCTDCHNPHTLKLKYSGNNLCLQCHEKKYDTQSHSFHDPQGEAGQCINCHMTGKEYMGHDFRRDHSFRIPRPDQSLSTDIPNACNTCHQDKSAEWAARQVKEWYGEHKGLQFSDYLIQAANPSISDSVSRAIQAFILNEKFPAIARATALEYLPSPRTDDELELINKAFIDSSALVRLQVLNKFFGYPVNARIEVAKKGLKDSVRSVRIQAARLLVDIEPSMLPDQYQTLLTRARAELDTMLEVNADFSTGQLQYGDFYMRQGKLVNAIRYYRSAIHMDSLMIPAYTNLATAYNMQSHNDSSLIVLNELLQANPGYGRGYYLRGLLRNEMNDQAGAVKDLKRSIELYSTNFRGFYNLANLLYQMGKLEEAKLYIQRGLRLNQASREGKYLLALIYQKEGKDQAAREILKTMNK